jgi:preprotein translocase subunit SecB
MSENGHDEDSIPATAAAPAPAAGQAIPQFSVNVQFVKDLSFENPNAPQSLVAGKEPPNVQVQVNVAARNLMQDVFEVILSITGKASHGADTAFIVEVAYGGVFTLTNVPEDAMRPLLLIECPRFLFPFARAVIADATREGGFPPLMIQPIDFVELYRRQGGGEAVGPTPVATA